MYSSSSQVKHWIFDDENDIQALREDSNSRFLEENNSDLNETEKAKFLSVKEERQLVQYYEFVLKDFCGKFSPSMPRYVVGTTMAYMKRFYIENSVMDYHPRDVMLTSLYLACKVEEFNVSIAQFVGNLKGDRNKAADLVLSYELMVMEKLHFQLTVHSPYRPLEGFIIDLKTRYRQKLDDPEKLRKAAEAFLDGSLNTDVMLLFPPAHIAMAALRQSASVNKVDLDEYFSLLVEHSEERLLQLKSTISKIRNIVKKVERVNRENIKRLEQKLEKCRNQSKNPASEEWKRKIQEAEEEETAKTFKRRKGLSDLRREGSDDSSSRSSLNNSDGFKPIPP